MDDIYFIEKEFLRTDVTTGKEMRIWCGNGQTYGYSYCLEVVDEECKRLNKENKYKNIRYSIRNVKGIN
ncbi:MAG: hypothetical protein NSGCLCUN01_02241 [uncultured Clostridium sp.]